LTGKTDYPPADPTVDGGLVTEMSPLFPNDGIDLDKHITSLPPDGSVPHMPGWRWIHTPGHTPGHISLFREGDRSLIAGDAFVTVKQESLYKVIVQEPEFSGPPKYFTTDWRAAWESVKKLERLRPAAAVTGHGRPMSGETLAAGLQSLAEHFDRIAMPKDGRYVH
jgi:glyoxylase-like metal-dependent hydrolase (beta-lactamase superfamily II)